MTACLFSFVKGYEFADGSVVGFFDFWRKVAGWKFIVRSMTSNALTTSTFKVTRICAWTVRQVDFQIGTFTHFIHCCFYINNLKIVLAQMRARNYAASARFCSQQAHPNAQSCYYAFSTFENVPILARYRALHLQQIGVDHRIAWPPALTAFRYGR